ncbi:DUF1134 domain-containing protein [Sphingorhabdus soli]|uniref:DUF1134 domain-containing protein n=1 Tax=Flavisphingopyxis soli TaxID=2601267 RepID=A0A5C6UPR6_9SPHN|nr:DUF1134 domain-containing protein [Sphingorhabdus soli]TXC74136.1 DUF1134 domain-containing protein [Sphingorhabdus soli]
MRAPLISAALLTLSSMGLASVPTSAAAQITTVDPNDVIDADLDQAGQTPASQQPIYPAPPTNAQDPYQDQGETTEPAANETAAAQSDSWVANAPAANTPAPGDSETYQEDDLIGAAEGVFGKGAQGLATMIEDILAKQGRPNGYIVGREAAGAFVLGLRYGSGTLFHKIEGERTVYWTGPSVGFDAGGNASQTFTLVYNLYDSQDLYKRFPAGEGAAYLVGGFTASYMRRGDVVLIPIRLGVGARLGVNVGYMRFSEKQKWLPF